MYAWADNVAMLDDTLSIPVALLLTRLVEIYKQNILLCMVYFAMCSFGSFLKINVQVSVTLVMNFCSYLDILLSHYQSTCLKYLLYQHHM